MPSIEAQNQDTCVSKRRLRTVKPGSSLAIILGTVGYSIVHSGMDTHSIAEINYAPVAKVRQRWQLSTLSEGLWRSDYADSANPPSLNPARELTLCH